MINHFTDNLQNKLERRITGLRNTPNFHSKLKQFVNFLESHYVFLSMLDDLKRKFPEAESKAHNSADTNKTDIVELSNENEAAAVAAHVIKICFNNSNPAIERLIGKKFGYGESKTVGQLEMFKEHFIEPLYVYLDEQLDDNKTLLYLITRYKQKCEWFKKEELYKQWKDNTKRGEGKLGLNFYEYLHDQGIENFSIEPWSASGRVDLVAWQKADDPLIADAKIFNPKKSKGKTYISKGFNQIYVYTQDHNKPFGYLVIFNTSEKDLRFALKVTDSSIPYVTYNNKTIFLITINIYPHGGTASQKGKLEAVEITEEDLIKIIE